MVFSRDAPSVFLICVSPDCVLALEDTWLRYRGFNLGMEGDGGVNTALHSFFSGLLARA